MNLPPIENPVLMILLICANFIKDCENLAVKGQKKMFVNWGQSKLKTQVNNLFQTQTLWPNGQILYYIDDFSFDKVLKTRLRGYLEEVSSKTDLQFLEMPLPPDDRETRWVLFINRIGQLQCQDYSTKSFTDKGVQRVVVGYDCVGPESFGLSAAILALAGVPPQHNAPNRDKFITVMQDNIEPNKQEYFTILREDEWPFGSDDSYDFFSAGHYDFYKYSLNGSATMVPKIQVENSLVGEGALSDQDIAKIISLYKYQKSQMRTDSEVCAQLYKSQSNKSPLKEKAILLLSDYNTSDD